MNFREWCESKVWLPGLLEAVRAMVGQDNDVFINRLTTLLSNKQSAISDVNYVVDVIRHNFTNYDSEWKQLDRQKQKMDLCDYLHAWHKIIDTTTVIVNNLIKKIPSKHQSAFLQANARRSNKKKQEKQIPSDCLDDDPMLYRSSLL